MAESGSESGQATLFINGYSASGRGWINQMNSWLAADMQLVTMDTRGHGRSEKPADGCATHRSNRSAPISNDRY